MWEAPQLVAETILTQPTPMGESEAVSDEGPARPSP
jgi:hypothetical protein